MTAHAESHAARLVAEQAALRRVATLVARGVPEGAVFAAVGEEVARLVEADVVAMLRFDAHETVTLVAGWSAAAQPFPAGARRPMGAGLRWAREHRRHVRFGSADRSCAGPFAPEAEQFGVQSSVGVLVEVGDVVWGMTVASSVRPDAFAADTEARIAGFAELVSTAISNAQARAELALLTGEQQALRHVATLVADGAATERVLAEVVRQASQLFDGHFAMLARADPGDAVTLAARHGTDALAPGPVGTPLAPATDRVVARVLATRRAVLLDDFDVVAGEAARGSGVVVGAGAPINVDGRFWGVLAVLADRHLMLPTALEDRLGEFADLVGAAIGNAEGRDELKASRARMVATADDARRRIQRDVHDGAQQRLVHAVITMKLARASLTGAGGEAVDLLDAALNEAERATAELRGLARGILPAVLVSRGLLAGVESLTVDVPIPVHVDVLAERLPAALETTAYFIVTEALANTVRHARAARAAVRAVADGGVLELEVTDDGVGGADPARGSGLLGIADRAAAAGGTMTIESPPACGTAIRVSLPLAPELGHAPVASRTFAPRRTVSPPRPPPASAPPPAAEAWDRPGTDADQAAFRRVATLVARGVPEELLCHSVSAEIARLAGAQRVEVQRLLPGGGTAVVAWSGPAVDDPGDTTASAPIMVDGAPWGVVLARSLAPLPETTGSRMAAFAELLGIAVSNAQAQVELRERLDEQHALRNVAMLLARGAEQQEVFGAVVAEAAQLLGEDLTALLRYGPGGDATVVALHGATGSIAVGMHVAPDSGALVTRVFESGLPVRVEQYDGIESADAARARASGLVAGAGAPIIVAGRIWGTLAVLTRAAPLRRGVEDRLAQFAELVASAIANAESRAEVAASRARIVAAADRSRLRLQRDVHEGPQRRLLHAVASLRSARCALAGADAVPASVALVEEALEHLELAAADLRALVRGVMPAALTGGGLRAGVEALAGQTALPVEVAVPPRRVSSEVETTAYFIVAEALTNVVKHAGATKAEVRIAIEDDLLRVLVRDDGRGGADPRQGTGLVGLADRAAASGGDIAISSVPGHGTAISVIVPLARADRPDAGD